MMIQKVALHALKKSSTYVVISCIMIPLMFINMYIGDLMITEMTTNTVHHIITYVMFDV